MQTKKLQIVGSLVKVDATLTQSGKAADAQVTGEAISNLNSLVGDEPVATQIANAIVTATDDEILALLTEIDALPSVTDESGAVFTDETGAILLI